MNGFAVGSGVMTATIPRDCGLSTQTESVKPWAGGASRPSCSNTTGTMWNWTSGAGSGVAGACEAAVLADVEVSGPWPCIHCERLASVRASFSETSSWQN